MADIVTETICELLLSKPIESASHYFKGLHDKHQLKQSIEDFCGREFKSRFENADRNSEVDFGALQKYVLGEGISLIYQVLTASPSVDTDHIRDSLYARACYYAGAKSDNAKEATRKFIKDIITITSAFLIEKCEPENRALMKAGVESINQNTNKKCDQILGRIGQLEFNLIIPNPEELSLVSDEDYAGFDGMPRCVMPCSEGSFDFIGYGFSGQKRESLLDVCLRDRHIVVVGEAGAGKTYALQQLFVDAKKLNYTPIETVPDFV